MLFEDRLADHSTEQRAEEDTCDDEHDTPHGHNGHDSVGVLIPEALGEVGAGLIDHEVHRNVSADHPKTEHAVAEERLFGALVIAGFHDKISENAGNRAGEDSPEAHAGNAHEKSGQDSHDGDHAKFSGSHGKEHKRDAGDERPECAEDRQKDGYEADRDSDTASEYKVKDGEKTYVDEIFCLQFVVHNDYLQNKLVSSY